MMRQLSAVPRVHLVAAVAVIGVASYAAALTGGALWAGDYSVDQSSPEVPFTFAPGDVVQQNGGAVQIPRVLLGLNAGDNVDALSYGDDQPEPFGIENLVNFDFSVDRSTVGRGGSVSIQRNGNGAAGDKFRVLLFKNGRTVGPFLQSDAPNHQLTPLPGVQSDLDALSLPAGAPMHIYFSLDRSGSSAVPSAGPADILYVAQPGVTPPVVWATAAQLGLDPGDNIDGLCIVDNGSPETFGPSDVVYVSLDRTSPTRNAPGRSGGDDVFRVAPQPLRVIYDALQLDLVDTTGEELNAMTGRDPGWPDASGNTTIPERWPWFLLGSSPLGALGNKSFSRTPRVTLDGPGGVRLRVQYAPDEEPDDLGRRLKMPLVSITSEQSNGFAFGAIDGLATRAVYVHYFIDFPSANGLRSGVSNAGFEISIPAPNSTVPLSFAYLGVSYNTQGLLAFANTNGSNVGTPQLFNATTRVECQTTIHPMLGLDMAARVPGGEWMQVYSNPTFSLGDGPYRCGVGAAGLDAGGGVRLGLLGSGGDVSAGLHPYLFAIRRSVCHLDRSEIALLDSLRGASVQPNPQRAAGFANSFVAALVGSPGAGKSKTYANGLIEQTRDESLGAMPVGTSGKKVSSRLKKAAKLGVKVGKLLGKKKLNIPKVRKAIDKSRSALYDAQELLIYGVTVK